MTPYCRTNKSCNERYSVHLTLAEAASISAKTSSVMFPKSTPSISAANVGCSSFTSMCLKSCFKNARHTCFLVNLFRQHSQSSHYNQGHIMEVSWSKCLQPRRHSAGPTRKRVGLLISLQSTDTGALFAEHIQDLLSGHIDLTSICRNLWGKNPEPFSTLVRSARVHQMWSYAGRRVPR